MATCYGSRGVGNSPLLRSPGIADSQRKFASPALTCSTGVEYSDLELGSAWELDDDDSQDGSPKAFQMVDWGLEEPFEAILRRDTMEVTALKRRRSSSGDVATYRGVSQCFPAVMEVVAENEIDQPDDDNLQREEATQQEPILNGSCSVGSADDCDPREWRAVGERLHAVFGRLIHEDEDEDEEEDFLTAKSPLPWRTVETEECCWLGERVDTHSWSAVAQRVCSVLTAAAEENWDDD